MDEMEITMEEYSQMMNQCGGTFLFTQPRDPSGSGSSFHVVLKLIAFCTTFMRLIY